MPFQCYKKGIVVEKQDICLEFLESYTHMLKICT